MTDASLKDINMENDIKQSKTTENQNNTAGLHSSPLDGYMDVHFSSKSNEWETPEKVYEALCLEFNFTLDPCATKDNAKCEKYYTMQDDGLSKDWSNDTVFMNPPYGREIGEWVKKAYESSRQGATVVCLIPSRTDTLWWHKYCMKGEVRLLRGRLKFINRMLPSWKEDGNFKVSSAPFPSAIVIFRPAGYALVATSI